VIAEPPPENIPQGDPAPQEKAGDFDGLVIWNDTAGNDRNLPAARPSNPPARSIRPARPSVRRHRKARKSWSDLAASVLQSWPRTFRACVVLVTLAASVGLIAWLLKINGQLLLALLGLRTRRR
jgi:hypothetical protein